MMIYTETQTIAYINLTDGQRAAIKATDEALEMLYDAFSANTTLESVMTGECFRISDLRKVRGILDMLMPPMVVAKVLKDEE